MKNKYLLIAGDKRQRELFSLLRRKENSVRHIDSNIDLAELKNEISQSKNIILPSPISRDGTYIFSDDEKIKIKLDDIITCLSKENKVFAGAIKKETADKLSDKAVEFKDILKQESFVIYNAFLTAHGLLRLLLENTDEYLPEKRILITGFGNVAKAAAKILCQLGCDVYIAARSKKAQTEAAFMNCKVISTNDINSTVYLFDFIINTVPSRLFGFEDISCMKKDSKYMELASFPFGSDPEDFERANRKFILASALPGRFFEKAAAKAIFNEII